MSDTTRIFYTDGELSSALDVIREQTVEIERLRAALKQIRSESTDHYEGDWSCVAIARKALGEKNE